MSKYTFGKNKRITANSRFKEVMTAKNCARTAVLVVFAAENGLDHSRLGVSVGKRFGNAVTRNRLKRLLREAFRINQHITERNYDFIVMYNPALAPKTKVNRDAVCFEDVCEAFKLAAVKLESRLAAADSGQSKPTS